MNIILFAYSHIEYTIQLSEALSKLECIKLMIPEKQFERFKNVIDKDLNLYSYYQPRLRYTTNLLMIYKIIRQIMKFRPDVIHLQGEHPWFDLTLPFLSRKYPIVITVHDVILHSGDKDSSRIPSFIYKLNRKYANQTIVHGAKLKTQMIQEFNNSVDNVHVLPRGINSIYTRYKIHPVKEEDHTVLFFGRIWSYKGLQYLIEAEPFITEKLPTLKIVIAGRGEDLQKYQKMILHKERFIFYNEHITNEMVSELFQKSSIVVLPYTDASQSGVIPLAYAFKKPVIVTNVGSLPEVVENGKTGYVVPPKNPKKLAESIIDLLKDDNKRKNMGENAYKKAERDLSWEKIAPRTLEVYKKAIKYFLK